MFVGLANHEDITVELDMHIRVMHVLATFNGKTISDSES